MNRNRLFIFTLIFVLLLAACQSEPDPTPTAVPPTDTPTEEPIAEDSVEEPTEVPTKEPTEEPTETPVEQSTDNEGDVAEEEAVIESRFPLAEITNDEGGPVSITGIVSYTNPFFTMGVAAPVIILEDQAGFVPE